MNFHDFQFFCEFSVFYLFIEAFVKKLEILPKKFIELTKDQGRPAQTGFRT
jgi:hypothetical protein